MTHSLVQERTYFITLAALSEKIIQQINASLKEKKGRSGSTIKIDLYGMPLEIKFYKTFSRRNQKIISDLEDAVNGKVKGVYIGAADGNPAQIEISINSAKQYEQYWKDRSIEDILSKGLPKFLEELIRHEITHAYDDLVVDIFKYNQDLSEEKALNSNTERNAFLNEFLSSLLKHSQMIKYYMFGLHDIKKAMQLVVREFDLFPFSRKMSEDTKKWMLKNIYTTLSGLIEE